MVCACVCARGSAPRLTALLSGSCSRCASPPLAPAWVAESGGARRAPAVRGSGCAPGGQDGPAAMVQRLPVLAAERAAPGGGPPVRWGVVGWGGKGAQSEAGLVYGVGRRPAMSLAMHPSGLRLRRSICAVYSCPCLQTKGVTFRPLNREDMAASANVMDQWILVCAPCTVPLSRGGRVLRVCFHGRPPAPIV